METDETENGNEKLKRKTEMESGKRKQKAGIRKWSSELFQELTFAHARIVALRTTLCYQRMTDYYGMLELPDVGLIVADT